MEARYSGDDPTSIDVRALAMQMGRKIGKESFEATLLPSEPRLTDFEHNLDLTLTVTLI